LLAGEALQKKYPDQFSYFPSYEILMDELRDYRFYADDMIHTSDKATAYIWEKFQEVLISEESSELISDLELLLKMVKHRPMNNSQEMLEKHALSIEDKLKKLKIKYSGLNWDKIPHI
jgi:hypothetical protein